MQALMDLRHNYREPFQSHHHVKLGIMGFFVKACTEALKRYPVVNASLEGEEVVYHGYFDIGVAVSTSRGLVVPVLRNADKLSLADIERSIATFGNKGEEGKLTIDELTGGTFTISNGGVFGSMLSTPILNPPQSAILGLHRIEPRPVAEGDKVVIRPMMYLALSYDHRIIDGREAVLFLVAIKELIEDPTRFILQV
jgi:2-oxoglutarate dehydrogenase E2 component (dihydrolipoamide succinyltransferase)